MKIKWLFFFAFGTFLLSTAKADINSYSLFCLDSINEVSIEITDYGLIFTDIVINGTSVKSMIDFGDSNQLQLSSSLTKTLGLNIHITNSKVVDLFGNSWDLFEGKVEYVKIGDWLEKEMIFTMQEGEMKAVSRQIDFDFHAVIGWGYFEKFITEIDYKRRKFNLHLKDFEPKEDLLGVPFSMDSGQLIISCKVKGQEMNFMIDTGSPVTVVDPKLDQFLIEGILNFEIQGKSFHKNVFLQDLSALADLEVVGIIGGDFLSLYRIILNPRRKIIYLIENI